MTPAASGMHLPCCLPAAGDCDCDYDCHCGCGCDCARPAICLQQARNRQQTLHTWCLCNSSSHSLDLTPHTRCPRSFVIQLLPAAVVAPLFFQGKIDFGVINQSQSAFNHILSDVSLVVRWIIMIGCAPLWCVVLGFPAPGAAGCRA